MRVAITRGVSPSINQCELTFLPREKIDLRAARLQHQQYEESLESLGCNVQRLPVEPDLPDSVFVEDTAIVLDEVAIIARPGRGTRRQETFSVARRLVAFRSVFNIHAPGTLEGGDVLRVGSRLYAGQSDRSNAEGLRQLQSIVDTYDYEVRPVEITKCLHLKSAVTRVGVDTLLINPSWVDKNQFTGVNLIEVHPEEPFAANALRVGETVLYPAEYPRTRERLEKFGIRVIAIEMSQLAKAEGGITCCSLLFHTQGSDGHVMTAYEAEEIPMESTH